MSGEDIISFALENPWSPPYPARLMRRFLTDFVSSQKMIFDISDNRGRLAVAVLLDKVSNLANDACLEILGCRKEADPVQVFLHFVQTASKHIPENRAGFQVGLPDKFILSDRELMKSGLVHYYDTFKMLRPSLAGVGGESPPEISPAVKADAEDVYQILCESFAGNPETSIPERDPWISGFLGTSGYDVYLWRKNGKTLGFAHLACDEGSTDAEIRTIGVLAGSRKLGIGQELLEHCLREAHRKGYTTCNLTVAAENERALGLYLRCGFNTIEKFRCFRMPK